MKLKLLTGQRFGNLVVGERIGNKYQCQCDCGVTTVAARGNITQGITRSCDCLRSMVKRGDLNPMWRGEKVGYSGVHSWVRNRYQKPKVCEHCSNTPPRDLANKTGKYLRDLSDWWYLCRKCHMDLDGRNDKLRVSGRLRKGVPKALWREGVQQ